MQGKGFRKSYVTWDAPWTSGGIAEEQLEKLPIHMQRQLLPIQLAKIEIISPNNVIDDARPHP